MNLDGDALSQIYGQCAAELRLNAEGAFHVQRDEVDEYCGGPCLEETKLALQCVEEVAAESFRFSNGASVLAVRQALGTGCGYGPDRGGHARRCRSCSRTPGRLLTTLSPISIIPSSAGTFEIRERKDCVGGADEYYYHKPRDHAQQKPAAGGRFYGEEEGQQPYEQGAGYGEGEEQQHCYGYGAAGGLAEHRGLLRTAVPAVLVASAALLLKL